MPLEKYRHAGFRKWSPTRMKATSETSKRTAGLLVALAVMFITVIRPPAAGAYVLEVPHVLDLTARAMGKLTALKIDQKLIIYPRAPDDFPTVLDETAIYVMPQRFRSDIVSDRLQRTYLEVADHALTVIDGRLTTDRDPFDLYQRLLRSRTRFQLMATLADLGVETAISSLGRIDKTVVYVLGARYPDESISQLAVDKETFLPVRLLLTNGGAGQRLTVQYDNWKKVQDGWFPSQVSFSLNDHLVREIRVVQIRVNPSLPAEMMDPEALMASVAAANGDSLPEQKQQAVDDVQQGVLEFQKKFE